MNENTKRGLDLLQAALWLGLLGDALLRATPWGLNVFLWTTALVIAALALLARWRRSLFVSEGRWLILPVILSASAFLWRDSLTLRFLDAMALLLSLALASLGSRGARVRLAGVVDYASGVIVAGFNAAFGFFPLLLRDIAWKEIPRAGWSRHLWAIMRGLVIAVPLLLVFGGLFVAADAVFEGIVNKTFQIKFDVIFGHIFLTIFCAWVVGGFLRGMLAGKKTGLRGGGGGGFVSLGLSADEPTAKKAQEPPAQPASSSLRLGIVEVAIVLGLLDLLFLSFVTVQIRYFFGGAALVHASTGMTYAEYARRGFFELVWVAALVLPLLLAAHWLLRKEKPLHERIFRVLAGAQLALLFVIMASAVGRMQLYQNEYGLTELRLYTMAFMGWLFAVFVWLALTVLRGRRERFACGAVVAGFLVIGALHVLNPDALIVRVNIAQARAGRSFDAAYAASLSADAVPELLLAWPSLSAQERCTVARRINASWSQRANTDWRTWNWSHAEARRLAQDEALRQTACPENVPDAPDRVAAPATTSD